MSNVTFNTPFMVSGTVKRCKIILLLYDNSKKLKCDLNYINVVFVIIL